MDLDPEDRREVANRLQAYLNRFDEISNLTRDKRTFKPDERARLQELLRALKDDLKEEAKGERQDDLTPAEKAFFYPAIFKASVRLRIRVNSNPAEWHSDLYSARLDISHLHNQLIEGNNS